MTEFSLIERYCQGIGASHESTILGVGDDAALLQVPPGMELVVSVDTMVEGVHFFPEVSPANLAHKLTAVNLSDMAAMGAEPRWATLALSLPHQDNDWLAEFSQSLDQISTEFGLQLVGGDTTQGPLILTMQVMGLVEQGSALRRNGARPGDDIYVSGAIGDAALALASLQGKASLDEAAFKKVIKRLETPVPQLKLGRALRGVGTSCIDISDGLIAELEHIAQNSQVAMKIDIDQVPVSDSYRQYVSAGGALDLALTGGDDYQLLFTAPTDRQQQIKDLSEALGIKISKIGQVLDRMNGNIESDYPLQLHFHDKPFKLQDNSGYQHFQSGRTDPE